MVGVAVFSPERSEVMFGAIVVGLLVSALAAGTIFVVRAWLQSRGARVREVPPLIVIPRPVAGVEPIIGSAAVYAAPTPPAQNGTSPRPPRASRFPAYGERLVFDDN